jgi:hypothetical protein
MRLRSFAFLAASACAAVLATFACGNSPPPAPPPQPSATATAPPVDSTPPVASIDLDAGPPPDAAPAGPDFPVTVLAKGQHATSALVADDSIVYWVEDQEGIVSRIPKRGGAMMMFYSASGGGFAAPSTLALDDNWVFWTEHVKLDPANPTSIGRVMKQDKNGGQATIVAQGIRDALTSLASDAKDLYWLAGAQIMSASKAGGGAHPVTLKLSDPTSVASDGKSLFFTQTSNADKAKPGGAVLETSPRPGSKIVTLATGLSNPNGVLVDDANVYWIEGGTKVMSLAKKAGGAPKSLAESTGGIVDLALDDTFAYWVTADGNVVRVAKDGSGSPTTLAAGQTNPVGIAVDRTNVFWSTKGTEANKFHDGTVATVTKP